MLTGSLDRAMDVAATLELRGFAAAPRAPRLSRPWSRHDLAFSASAVAILALALLASIGGVASFTAYPLVHAPIGLGLLALCGALVLAILLPFADRRGIEP
jgi:energy-coupling factor transport system permease protein